jgi:hypothetical protein
MLTDGTGLAYRIRPGAGGRFGLRCVSAMTVETPVIEQAPAAAPDTFLPDSPRGRRRGPGPLGRALELRAFLSETLDPAGAAADVQAAVEGRDDRFLTAVRRLVYEQPASPYQPLLRAADCTYADLEASVRERGLEPTLRALRDAGVYVTADEWKGRAPIVRPGLELEVTSSHFDNATLTDAVTEGGSSGSSGGPSRRTPVGKIGLADFAADFTLLLEEYGVLDAPTAAWMPRPPGGGLIVMLLWAKLGNPPERWFSQTKPAGTAAQRVLGSALNVVSRSILGVRLPGAEHTELADADKVAAWLGSQSGPRVLQGFTSSIVRAAHVALERGIDLTGAVAVLGGEPADEGRTRFLESVGFRVAATYGATDGGMIGLGCADPGAADDYHVCSHRCAVIPADDAESPAPLLITTLSPYSGKVLLNADIGDRSVIEERECDCRFGRLGLVTHLRKVHSRHLQTSEGMTVPVAQLLDVVHEQLAPLGATRNDYQIQEVRNESGASRLTLVVSPRLAIEPQALAGKLLDGLAARNPGAKLAADVWRQAGTLTVESAPPALTPLGKLLPVVHVES